MYGSVRSLAMPVETFDKIVTENGKDGCGRRHAAWVEREEPGRFMRLERIRYDMLEQPKYIQRQQLELRNPMISSDERPDGTDVCKILQEQ